MIWLKSCLIYDIKCIYNNLFVYNAMYKMLTTKIMTIWHGEGIKERRRVFFHCYVGPSGAWWQIKINLLLFLLHYNRNWLHIKSILIFSITDMKLKFLIYFQTLRIRCLGIWQYRLYEKPSYHSQCVRWLLFCGIRTDWVPLSTAIRYFYVI